MKYPYFLMDKEIQTAPVVKLSGQPLIINLDEAMARELMSMEGDSVKINDWFDKVIKESGKSWAMGSYLENRELILSQYEHMSIGKRYYHLGIDICAPAGTPVYAPLLGVVEDADYEPGTGNYGGYVILRHEIGEVEPFYSLYGHMSLDSLPEKGSFIKAGEEVALIGDLQENGGWNHHTHIQIITSKGKERGFFFKGYCSESDLKEIEELCPNPMSLLTVGVNSL